MLLEEVSSFEELVLLLKGNERHELNFLMDEGLLKSTAKCSSCRCKMRLENQSSCKFGALWRCSRQNKCRKTKSVCHGSFFSKTNIPLREVVYCIYLWAMDVPAVRAADILCLRHGTVLKVYEHVRDVCLHQLLQTPEEFVYGGPGEIVEIEESLLAQRKCITTARTQLWVLGICKRGAKRGFIQVVEKRDAATLIPIIQQHVRPGTEIHTSCWSAYNDLAALGYNHKTVNHSQFFKDPMTGACTNSVKGLWATYKRKLRQLSLLTSPNIDRHLKTLMWKNLYGPGKTAFPNIIAHIKAFYE